MFACKHLCRRQVRYGYLCFDRPPPAKYSPSSLFTFDRIGAWHPSMTHRAGAKSPVNTCPCRCVNPQNSTIRHPLNPGVRKNGRENRVASLLRSLRKPKSSCTNAPSNIEAQPNPITIGFSCDNLLFRSQIIRKNRGHSSTMNCNR